MADYSQNPALAESMVCQAPRLGDTEGHQPVTWLQRWWTVNIRNCFVWLSVGDDKRWLEEARYRSRVEPSPHKFLGSSTTWEATYKT